jgi:hypothetical protein
MSPCQKYEVKTKCSVFLTRKPRMSTLRVKAAIKGLKIPVTLIVPFV